MSSTGSHKKLMLCYQIKSEKPNMYRKNGIHNDRYRDRSIGWNVLHILALPVFKPFVT